MVLLYANDNPNPSEKHGEYFCTCLAEGGKRWYMNVKPNTIENPHNQKTHTSAFAGVNKQTLAQTCVH